MKHICVGMGVVLSVVLGGTSASARSIRGTLEDTLFGGQQFSFVTVEGRPLLSADPRRFGQPIFVTGSASLGRDITAQLQNEVLSESAVVPVPSGSAGFAYEYDPALNLFQRKPISLGTIFNERVTTLGKGGLAFGVAYIRQEFDEYNGKDISNLRVRSGLFAGELPTGALIDSGVVDARLDLDITTNTTAVWGTYGLTEWLDISFLLPITVIDFQARSTIRQGSDVVQDFSAFLSDSQCTPARAQQNQCRIADFTVIRSGTTFNVETRQDVVDETRAGVGDLILRSKARFFEHAWGAFGGLAEFTLPTGDKDNFLGDDAVKARFLLLHSASFFENRLNFHLNGGGRITTEVSRKNTLEYGSSVDFKVTDRLSVVAELIGSWRVDADGIPDNFIDGAFGFKANLFGRLILNSSFRIPATDDGLRSDLVYLAGLEYSF